MSSIPQAKSRLVKAPNLDMHDKLVKRGLVVCWYGYRGAVKRVRTGRCLVEFVTRDPRSDASRDVDKRWLPCSSVYVVPS
ncbi:hypothetical protein [Paracidovorax avenae]|uniref:hypothetical protein n=1 Tax=Paracidovorax avenae TaxID=80867 RepID=UPI001AD81DCF|nr:hypothetical protein [Paracidovorax avenae]